MQLISTEYISYILTPDCHESGSLEAMWIQRRKAAIKTTSGKWRKGREEGQLLPPTSLKKKKKSLKCPTFTIKKNLCLKWSYANTER